MSTRAGIDPRLAALLPELVALRRDLHAHPELGFQERRTAAIAADWLRALPRMRVRTGVAGTGVIATLDGPREGPCLALRADMDALPMDDTCGRPHASRHPGATHACGHDGNVACLLGAARLLAADAAEGRLRGTVRFIFQPAEEGGGGARPMIEQGALDDPAPAAIFALHAWPQLPLGAVGVCSGPAMASTDAIDMVVRGRGAHAATPHMGADPVVAAAHVVVALQAVVSRLTDPLDPAVVTIGRVAGGEARNVIPGRVALEGTLRALTETQRAAARAAVRQVAVQTAAAFGCTAEVELREGYPVTVNDPAAAAFFAAVARRELGAAQVRADLPPGMGGEDFAFYLQRVPGALWRLGVAPTDGSPALPLHNPAFDFPDEALAIGVGLHCALARAFPDRRRQPAAARGRETT